MNVSERRKPKYPVTDYKDIEMLNEDKIIMKIKINKDKAVVLTPEQWQGYIDEIMEAAPIIANMFLKINHEGRGQEDHDDYLTSQIAAIAAMNYVKEFAADKCIFASAEGVKFQ